VLCRSAVLWLAGQPSSQSDTKRNVPTSATGCLSFLQRRREAQTWTGAQKATPLTNNRQSRRCNGEDEKRRFVVSNRISRRQAVRLAGGIYNGITKWNLASEFLSNLCFDVRIVTEKTRFRQRALHGEKRAKPEYAKCKAGPPMTRFNNCPVGKDRYDGREVE
jgi:hypothetical protein